MNWKLIFDILSSVNGGLITSAALFNPLIGQGMALKVISVLGICQVIVSAIKSNLSTQANQIKSVAAMPDVAKVLINENAGVAAATVAVDPIQTKVGATSVEARQTLVQTAKGT